MLVLLALGRRSAGALSPLLLVTIYLFTAAIVAVVVAVAIFTQTTDDAHYQNRPFGLQLRGEKKIECKRERMNETVARNTNAASITDKSICVNSISFRSVTGFVIVFVTLASLLWYSVFICFVFCNFNFKSASLSDGTAVGVAMGAAFAIVSLVTRRWSVCVTSTPSHRSGLALSWSAVRTDFEGNRRPIHTQRRWQTQQHYRPASRSWPVFSIWIYAASYGYPFDDIHTSLIDCGTSHLLYMPFILFPNRFKNKDSKLHFECLFMALMTPGQLVCKHKQKPFWQWFGDQRLDISVNATVPTIRIAFARPFVCCRLHDDLSLGQLMDVFVCKHKQYARKPCEAFCA